MASCPTCHQPATTRDGFDRRGRQRFACHLCHRDFTHASSSAFSGYRWPPEVIVTAVRWYAPDRAGEDSVDAGAAQRDPEVEAELQELLQDQPSQPPAADADSKAWWQRACISSMLDADVVPAKYLRGRHRRITSSRAVLCNSETCLAACARRGAMDQCRRQVAPVPVRSMD